MTSNNNIYTEDGDIKDDYICTSYINTNRNSNNNYSNELMKNKLNIIKKRTSNLLEIFSSIKINYI